MSKIDCPEGMTDVDQQCVATICATVVPLVGKKICSGYGECGEGATGKCTCDEGLGSSDECNQCTIITEKVDLESGNGCAEADCKMTGQTEDCGGNGYCQKYDKESSKVQCHCKPGFTGKYCDACNTGYLSKDGKKCNACASGYIEGKTDDDMGGDFMCLKNKCDPNTTNMLCSLSATPPTCVKANDEYLCSCSSMVLDRDKYCLQCSKGYSFNSNEADKTCVASQCWTSSMDAECTNIGLGKCEFPSGQEHPSPYCTCRGLTKPVSSGINYCSECMANNMVLEKGCLCSNGYKLVKNGDSYSCVLEKCVNNAVIAALPKCAGLYEDINLFLNENGMFDIAKYNELYSECQCAGAGECNNNECTKCNSVKDVEVLDKTNGCAACLDNTKRFFVNNEIKDQAYCYEDTCTTDNKDCNGWGKCTLNADTKALICECNDGTGLSGAEKCTACTEKDFIFAEPPPDEEEEEEKGEIEKSLHSKSDEPKPPAQCVEDNCTAKSGNMTVCNSKGQCYLYYKGTDTSELEAKCVCGELVNQCTGCADSKKLPYNTSCYEHNCGESEVEGTKTYCNNNGTCTSLVNNKLQCACKYEFTGNLCATCGEAYEDIKIGETTFKCLGCKSGYKPMVEGSEGTESVMCLKNNCPSTGCNSDANAENQCRISNNQWKCVCAEGYMNDQFLASGCTSCSRGYKKVDESGKSMCYPSTCTSEVYDPSNPELPQKDKVECSTESLSVTRGVCTRNSQTNSYYCACNKRFVGSRCEECGYLNGDGDIQQDENMISEADIEADKKLEKEAIGYKDTDICKCKKGFRFGDDGTGVSYCLANYCIVTKKACNNDPGTLGSSIDSWNDSMECCGVDGSNFSSASTERADDFGKITTSEVCELKNGSYRCMNCGSFSIFSANYKCSVCRDEINGRAGVKVGKECLEDNCKKTCNDSGVCNKAPNEEGTVCTCTDSLLEASSACTKCSLPVAAVLFDKKCICGDTNFAIITGMKQSCADTNTYDPITSKNANAVCIPRDCGTDGDCYGHGKCRCTDVEVSDTQKYPIAFKCFDCIQGYTLESNCQNCSPGYRKGPTSKTECVIDRCYDAKSGRVCNGLGTCTIETTDSNGVKYAECACNKNADRVFKGAPDCNTCISGYKFKPDSTICVENACLKKDEYGQVIPDFKECDEKGACNYERAYNKHRCKCNDSKYDTTTACTDCKENTDKGYEVRDPKDACKCIASKNLLEHPIFQTCVNINCRPEGAETDCNGKGVCVAGDEEYECDCNAGEDKANYCGTCLEPAEQEDGSFIYYSYPQNEGEGEDMKTICYLNNCERSKKLDDESQCYSKGKCIIDKDTTSFNCECITGYTSNTECRNCDDNYEMAPDGVTCTKIKYKMPAAGYVGIAFGVLLVIGVVCGIVYYRWKSKKIAEENERKITVDRTKTAQQPITVVTI